MADEAGEAAQEEDAADAAQERADGHVCRARVRLCTRCSSGLAGSPRRGRGSPTATDPVAGATAAYRAEAEAAACSLALEVLFVFSLIGELPAPPSLPVCAYFGSLSGAPLHGAPFIIARLEFVYRVSCAAQPPPERAVYGYGELLVV